MRCLAGAVCAIFLSISSSVVVQAQSYTFTRIAGVRPPRGTADSFAVWARFNTPGALALDASGNLYVADALNHAIRIVTTSGFVTTIAGLPGTAGAIDGVRSDARFSQPWGVAVDGNGVVWVADYGNHTIRKIATDGTVTTFAGEPGVRGSNDGTGSAAHFDSPAGIAVDSSGNLYVSDRGNCTIRKIAPNGAVSTIAGLAGAAGNIDGQGNAARFTSVAGLSIDSSGTLYIADSGSNLVRKMTPDGVVSTLAGTAMSAGSTDGAGASAQFNGLRGLGVDPNGNVFVADSLNHTIRKVAPDGTTSTVAGSTGIPGNDNGPAAQFFAPTGVVADGSGNLYVADSQNHSIRKITSDGTVSLYAGGGGNFGSADGSIDAARTHLPRSIALGSNGMLYVTDDHNATVRQISTSGVVNTLAGLASILANIDGAAANARFGNPFGIAVDAQGTAWVSDYTFNVIRRVGSDGTVQTFAGVSSTTGGFSDGAPGVGLLSHPKGLAADGNGNLYIADSGNHVIRKMSPDGTLGTIAGSAGVAGYADGSGTSAQFNAPSGIAIDSGGTLYVSDTGNAVIRKITPDGTVTTLAGSPGTTGALDGNGANARFLTPNGLAVDGSGNIYVADTDNETIRRITPDGTVTTIGGSPGTFGSADGTGSDAQFYGPTGLTVDTKGTLYIVDSINGIIVKGTIQDSAYAAPTILTPAQPLDLRANSDLNLSVAATGGGLTYQWQFNGQPIAGATDNTYHIANFQPGQSGQYSVTVTNSAGSVTSTQSVDTVSNYVADGYLSNASIRSLAGAGDNALIVGFSVTGQNTSVTEPLLVRAVGPTLATLGVTNALTTPLLQVFDSSGSLLNSGGTQLSSLLNSLTSLVVPTVANEGASYSATFAPGSYGLTISGSDASTGVTLAEIYDTTPSFTFSPSRLGSVTARAYTASGDSVMVAGFVIGGSAAKNILIRAIGPSLDASSVANPLSDPKLELYSGTAKLSEDDDWGGTSTLRAAFAAAGATPLSGGSKDSALLMTLPRGAYTVKVSGVGNTSGIVRLEIYLLP